MRILIINSLYRWSSFGGAEVSVELLVVGLRKRGHEVIVVCLDPKASSTEAGPYGETIVRMKSPNVYWQYAAVKRGPIRKAMWHVTEIWNPKGFWMMRTIIQKYRPDVVHTNVIAGFSSSIWSAAAAAKVPCLHTTRDYYVLCFRVTQYRGGKQCEGVCNDCSAVCVLRRRLARSLAAMVGISKAILDRHSSFGGAPTLRRVIYNPVPDVGVISEKAQNSQLRIGIIGRLAPEKGVLEFAASFSAQTNLKASLLIAGDGDAEIESGIKGIASRDQRVIHAGRVERGEFFRQIDLLVVPSRWNEPFGRIVVEGYSYGVPCLARSVGGLTELIEVDKTGWLFDSDIEAMQILLSLSMAREVIQRASQQAKKRSCDFAVESVAEQYEKLYDLVATNGKY